MDREAATEHFILPIITNRFKLNGVFFIHVQVHVVTIFWLYINDKRCILPESNGDMSLEIHQRSAHVTYADIYQCPTFL